MQPIDPDAETIERLAKLPLLEYERCREMEAARLGIKRVTILDGLVNPKRPDTKGTSQGNAVEPWPEPVDGAELLQLIASTFDKFCVLPAHASLVLAVSVLQTYCYKLFDFVGIVVVWSPEPECGKGRVLDVTEALAWNPFRTANTSAAVLYNVISQGSLTVLVDELDSQREDQREAISNILKSGFQSNGKAHRMAERNGEQVVAEFCTFSPKMVASIGLDTLDKATRTRSISVRMSRKPRGAKIAKFRRFDGTEIRRKCLRWVQDKTSELQAVGPLDLDECATDRQEDVWEPMVAIARVAGGECEARIREAARHLSGAASRAATESEGHQLLTAIRDYFACKGVSKVSTKVLLEHLNEGGTFLDFNRGRGLTPHFLAKLLKPYDITSRDLRMPDGKVHKGYDQSDCAEAFSVYLAESEVSKRYTATEAVNIGRNPDFEKATELKGSVSENAVPANKHGPGSGVAFQKLERGLGHTKSPELVVADFL